jgi:Arc/MetJ-type ribon-helix-helix transcriptional regulator
MKTLRISDDVHQKLTTLLGELMAQTAKMQTYQDAIEAMLSQSVILPPELLKEVESFIQKNKRLGYTTKEEFVREAIRFKLDWHRDEYEYFQISKEELEKLDVMMDALGAPASAKEAIREAIDNAIEGIREQYRFTREHELDKETKKKLDQQMKEIEEYWQDIRR